MNEARWRQVERICEAVMTAGADRREAVLADLCDGDAALRDEVESLLAQASRAESFLAAPAWQDAAAALVTGPDGQASMDRNADICADTALLQEGARLGPYEVGAPIGAGGMGTVYRARDTRLGRTVAIKVLAPVAAAGCGPAAPGSIVPSRGGSRRRRFEQEARTTSSLNHPHICVLYDLGSDGGTDYLVMEYLEGETLADRLARGPLPVGDALNLGLQIADALAAAHAAGIVHRDLKPANVMLTPGTPGGTGLRHAKLLDFGLARLLEPSSEGGETDPSVAPAAVSASLSGSILGTLPYMAPEQLGGGRADPRTDIWAFGCVICEMLTGERSFGASSPAGVVASILLGAPAALAALPPSTPPALRALLERCLAADPDTRWADMREVAGHLRRLADPTAATRRWREARRRRWAVGAAAVLAAGALGAAAGFNGSGLRDWITRPHAVEPAAPIVVAVMPFRNIGDPQFGFLAEGVFEDLINGLATVQGKIRPLSSTTTRRVAALGLDPEDVAARLGADRIIEGTSLREGPLVRFDVRVLDGHGAVLWGERVEGEAARVLVLQDMLLRRISADLGWDLPFEERARARPVDPRAYALLVRARSDRVAWTHLDAARQALTLSPDYADAHRVLAEGLARQLYYGIHTGSVAEVLREARDHAERAVTLDPANALAYATRAVVRFVGGDNLGADGDFVRALTLAPGNAHTLFYRSWFLAHFARYDECVATARELDALNPETPTDNLGWCLWLKQEYDDAAAALDRHRAVKDDDALYLAKLASAFARSGRVSDAQALRGQIREMPSARPGRHSGVDYHLVWVHLAEGDRAGAVRLAELWRRNEPQSGNLWTFVAQMYGALDDVDNVVDSAERSVDRCLNREPCAGGAAFLQQFFQEPSFYSQRVRADPRMLALVRRLESAASPVPVR